MLGGVFPSLAGDLGRMGFGAEIELESGEKLRLEMSITFNAME